ncbi:DUF3089 domain-containing protein [Polymorphobacter fuscus]|uniref:DUF3089 domain-containing protein n=1 Tax=Sandarakinorhabdus fusca TaxID=1439888 RepID=A0A7C9LHZ9_9SPHN|nr:DUF3089 domain-containing protein [Polymorphobacter fuscus]KAB7643886.1 DUF3089 domain-containing protein [Polymorphobacter fuscus]MQT18587.1 DUF3089 domain-containing protein [Polymorphobacter fuscus]NJC07046.1 hypothetical protein [Polymorphobacter fuscus]
MYARRFLWAIAIIVMIVIAAAFAYSLFGPRLLRVALVPTTAFSEQAAGPRPDYARLTAWAAHPGLKTDAARWTPADYAVAPFPAAAVFYVLPTSVFDRSRWNARADDAEMARRMDMFLRAQASVFNGIGSIWAPRYRQATFGAFLTDQDAAAQAQALAYGDVLAAFDAFVAAQPATRPIILAGHSQGSLHLIRLLKERIAGTPLAARIVAVYAPGWPISVTADLPALGLPACTIADETGCILSWQSFARPADYKEVRDSFDRGSGLTGAKRLGTEMLCSNPLSGMSDRTPMPAAGNFGSLVPNDDFSGGTLQAKTVGAACTATGILDIGEPPADFTAYVLPGNNYHVYDIPLFWANLRADVERRLDRFGQPVVTPKPPKQRSARA